MLLLSNAQIEQRLGISLSKLADLCQQWGIKEMALFGSILRNDFHQDSDIDFLISFDPSAPQGLLTLSKIKSQLETLLNYPVDIAIKDSINNSDNWIRRQEILTTAQTIVEKGCPGFSIKIQANSKEDLSYKVGLDLVLERP